MTTQDLRIGNYLDRNGLMEVCQIFGKTHSGTIKVYDHVNKCYINHSFDMSSFQPIPLTEDILLRFGFEIRTLDRNTEYHIEILNTDVYLRHSYRGGYYWGFNMLERDGCELEDVQPIQFVHQLQNLYFALTGEELILK